MSKFYYISAFKFNILKEIYIDYNIPSKMEITYIYHNLTGEKIKIYYDPKKKFLCDCGRLYSVKSKSTHIKSKTHITNKEMLESLEQYTKLE